MPHFMKSDDMNSTQPTTDLDDLAVGVEKLLDQGPKLSEGLTSGIATLHDKVDAVLAKLDEVLDGLRQPAAPLAPVVVAPEAPPAPLAVAPPPMAPPPVEYPAPEPYPAPLPPID